MFFLSGSALNNTANTHMYVRETFEAESDAVVIAVKVVSVAVAAVEVERETVAVF